jgi:C1A family cysteine protease
MPSVLNRAYKLRRQRPDAADVPFVPALAPHELPDRVDAPPQLPPPLDQGDLGACASNAASNGLRLRLRLEPGQPDFQPSRLFIYYTTRVLVEGSPADQDTGVELRDVCKALARYHVCREEYWPYDVARFSAPPDGVAVDKAAYHAALRYEAVPQEEHALLAALAQGLAVLVGIQVYASFESAAVAASGEVPLPDTAAEECLGGHAVLAVGYDRAARTVLLQNSWGAAWGRGGLFTLPLDYLLSPQLAGDFWAVRFFA